MRATGFQGGRHGGFSLVEVLVAVLVFSLGVLGLMRLQASAIRMSTDARQRAEATFLADQLFARMLISDRAQAPQFAHRTGGGDGQACGATGADSAHPMVVDWLAQVVATFPTAGANAAEVRNAQQIIVSNNNEVTVRLCWRNSENDTPHRLEVTNKVQWP